MFRGAPGKTLALLLGLVLIILLWIGVFDCVLNDDVAVLLKILGVVPVLTLPFHLLLWRLRCLGCTLTVTTHRTVLRHGIIAKRTAEVRHADVRTISVHQGILQRFFGVGGIAIGSAGHAGMEIAVDGIDKPDTAAAMIRERRGT